jgi:hypothetical protein
MQWLFEFLLDAYVDCVTICLQKYMLFGPGQVLGDHFFAHLLDINFRHPSQFLFSFGGVAQQCFDFGGAEVTGVDADDGLGGLIPGRARDDIIRGDDGVTYFINALAFPGDLHAQFGGGPFNELAHAILHASGDYKVLRLILLQHHPLHPHIVFGVAPVAQGVNVAHVQALFQPLADVGQAPGDLAGHKGLAPARAFMVEQDAVASIHAIGFAVVDRDPVGIELGHRIGAAGVKGGGFLLRCFLHQAIQFAGTGLVKAGFLLQPQDANGFQNAQGTNAVHVGGVFGAFKAHGHVAHGGQVIDLVGLRFFDDADQIAGVAQVAVVQLEVGVGHMGVLVDVVHALGVEAAGTALDTMDDVAFFEQEFSEVGAVLACDAGDECDFLGGHG